MPPKYDSCGLPNTNAVVLDGAEVGLHHSSGRKVRSERLKAIHSVIGVFLRHLDQETLWVGHWSPQGGFIPLDMATIARETGLCQRRCERSILCLKNIGFVSVFPQQNNCNHVRYAGLRVVRALTPAFFEWEGLSNLLDQLLTGTLHDIEDEGGQP